MKPTLHVVFLLAAAISVALLVDAWRSARHDSQQLAATLAAQNESIQQAASREKQRDSQLVAALAAIQVQKRSVHTPQQAAKDLPDVLPPLPLPVSVSTPNLSALSPAAENAATSISIPQPDLIPLYDGLQDCRASVLQDNTLQNNLADEKTRNVALLRERDAAVSAARGGTFFLRLKRAAKWFAIGAVAGAAVAAIARH